MISGLVILEPSQCSWSRDARILTSRQLGISSVASHLYDFEALMDTGTVKA